MAPIITNGNFGAATPFTPLTGLTGVAATNVITKVAHGLLDGQVAQFLTLTGGAVLTTGVCYYIRDKANDTFKVAATRGGTAVDFTTDITAGSIVRCGAGVPTGWTITKAGSSEVIAGNNEALSPSGMPINSYAEIKVDATPAAASAHEHITLVPNTRYRISLESYWAHEDPAEVLPAHAPTVSLVEDGAGHSLLSTGAWQANGAATINIPVPKPRGGRLAIPFVTPATHTAYTLTIDKGTMDGTAGYLEIVRITNVRIEPIAFDDPTLRPENNDTAFKALPQNS